MTVQDKLRYGLARFEMLKSPKGDGLRIVRRSIPKYQTGDSYSWRGFTFLEILIPANYRKENEDRTAYVKESDMDRMNAVPLYELEVHA